MIFLRRCLKKKQIRVLKFLLLLYLTVKELDMLLQQN